MAGSPFPRTPASRLFRYCFFGLPLARSRSGLCVCLGYIRLAKLATEPNALGHRATCFRIGRSDHGIIGLQAITLAILHRRHAVSREVAAQRLLGLAIDHADDVIGADSVSRRRLTLRPLKNDGILEK